MNTLRTEYSLKRPEYYRRFYTFRKSQTFLSIYKNCKIFNHVGQLRTSSVRISFSQDTTCIFNSLAGGRVTIVTMHSLGRLIHWTVTMFYSETDYRKFVASRPSSPVRQDGERRITFGTEYAFRRVLFSRFGSFYFLL